MIFGLFKKKKPKEEKLMQCSHCGNYYPESKFRNGHGQQITWCPDCGLKMCQALML